MAAVSATGASRSAKDDVSAGFGAICWGAGNGSCSAGADVAWGEGVGFCSAGTDVAWGAGDGSCAAGTVVTCVDAGGVSCPVEFAGLKNRNISPARLCVPAKHTNIAVRNIGAFFMAVFTYEPVR